MRIDEAPVIVEQDFDRSISAVWNALTDINEMRLWYFDNIPNFKAEVGFQTRFLTESGEREFMHQWTVTEVIPQQKIVYNWNYQDYPGDSNIHFELSGNDQSTHLKVTAEVLEDFPDETPEFARDSCEGGWTYFIQQSLKNYLNQ